MTPASRGRFIKYTLLFSFSETSDIRINYIKFRGGVSTDKCVIIDPNDNEKWDADDCQDETKYFICERIN